MIFCTTRSDPFGSVNDDEFRAVPLVIKLDQNGVFDETLPRDLVLYDQNVDKWLFLKVSKGLNHKNYFLFSKTKHL